MDECYCKAYPLVSSESRLWPNDQQHFSVDFQYSNMQVLNGSKLEEAFDNGLLHNFQNIPKNEMLNETTIVSCLSDVGVPQNAHGVVVAEVLRCARDMIGDTAHTHTPVLRMRVEIAIARANQDEISVSGNQDGITVTEISVNEISVSGNQDGISVSVIDSVSDDDNFEEAQEYGFDEDDEDYGLMPADKAFVEGLEDVQQKGSCAICFEDFLFGVRMPCLHAFHKSCISEWLHIGNSCPLCRFYFPTQSD
ncbi:E3 ubiquitin ligase BIG BROTHER-like [Vigna radiata var. radiata]|uniref:RING-type E3 ubiquitin transferase n=1 Tax=Vigna radiata var. radiata TaxID=3916 RepID=A0A1S3U0A5_VIGRR|nr:E3 ubiquitin ligase BIG BROTHER-like [Vigna radiata var. radiata]